MNPLLSSAWSRIRNLPFILQGDSPEKKLRLTLLIAGVASIVAGIFMATLNFSRGHHDIGCLYIASIALGGYIIIGAFSDRLERHLDHYPCVIIYHHRAVAGG